MSALPCEIPQKGLIKTNSALVIKTKPKLKVAISTYLDLEL